MRRPVRVFRQKVSKITGKKFSFEEVLSPFALKATDKQFLNYFNLAQAFFFEGTLDLTTDLTQLGQTISEIDDLVKVKTEQLGRVCLLSDSEREEIQQQLL